MTAILLVFQADSQHEEITDVYVGLIARRVESHLYAPDQILDFVKDIEVDLQVVRDALKARDDPSKRHAFCLFVSNFGGAMSIPTDPPYCLVYPTSYVREVDQDHFDTRNNLVGMRLCRCVCCATLQFNNDEPKERTNYAGSHLILPCGAQYNDWLFPAILELRNHCHRTPTHPSGTLLVGLRVSAPSMDLSGKLFSTPNEVCSTWVDRTFSSEIDMPAPKGMMASIRVTTRNSQLWCMVLTFPASSFTPYAGMPSATWRTTTYSVSLH